MKVHQGNILQVDRGIILQQVNCQGVMGSGVAAAIRGKYPIVYDEFRKNYKEHTRRLDSGLGDCLIVEAAPQLFVANLYGQLHFGSDGQRYTSYDALDESLEKLREWMDEHKWLSSDVHHPLLGSGLGGGVWNAIAALIEHRLGADTNLWIFERQP